MKVLIIIFLLLFSLVSCSKKDGLQEISIQEVFSVKEEKYCVLFYSPSCYSCLTTIEVLKKRYEKRKYKGFLVNLMGLDIEFNEEKVSNLGKDNINEIVFSSVPYLVYISKKSIEKEVYGYTNIQKENLYIFFE